MKYKTMGMASSKTQIIGRYVLVLRCQVDRIGCRGGIEEGAWFLPIIEISYQTISAEQQYRFCANIGNYIR